MLVSAAAVLSRETVKAEDARSTMDGWEASLKTLIADRNAPVHLVGVGNELRSDDAVGLDVASAIRARLGASPAPGVRVYVGSPTPERLLAKLAGKGRIVIFDAVEASAEAGKVVFRPMADTKYGFFGTHNIPLKLVPGLSERLGDVFLVGIQPASLEVALGLSEKVRDSVGRIVAVVAEGVEARV